MFTARNVVLLVIAICVISLVWACYSLMRPPDSAGDGADSYGTRRYGMRALYETLGDLGVDVQRGLAPPAAGPQTAATLVFWKPSPGMVAREPAYLHAISDWLQAGGHVVTALPDESLHDSDFPDLSRFGKHSESLLEALRAPNIDATSLDLREAARSQHGDQVEDMTPKKRAERPRGSAGASPDPHGYRRDADLMLKVLRAEALQQPTRSIAVECVGSLARLNGAVKTLEVPEERLQLLDIGNSTPEGQITFTDGNGTKHVVVASYKIGKGELIVVGTPELAENFLFAQQDNSILLAELIASSGRPVIFDEFYHGLTVRGNPLWLFTRAGFSVVTLCLLLVAGLVVWRDAIFLGPPLADPFTSRRSIGEYVVAMARFLNRGRAARTFVLEEVRTGVLNAVRRELNLPAGREAVEELAAILTRRDPQRAKNLVDSVIAINRALLAPQTISEKDAIRLLQGISSCL